MVTNNQLIPQKEPNGLRTASKRFVNDSKQKEERVFATTELPQKLTETALQLTPK